MLTPGVVAIYGPPGTLKTSIALTWPKPLKLYDFDMGSHRGWRVREMVESGEVGIKLMPMPRKSITTRHQQLDGFIKMWTEFVADFDAAFESPEVRTVVIDTNTMNWSLIRDAYLEELQKANPAKPRKQLLQIEYGEPNSRMRSIFSKAGATKTWLVVTMHETDEYAPITVGGKPLIDLDTGNPRSAPTGRKVPEGFRYTLGLADWVLHTEVERGSGLVPKATIEKSALGLDLVGLEINWFGFEKLTQRLEMLGRL